MAKTFTATWLGDGDPNAQIITEAGIRFIKGEPTKVPANHSYNGLPWADLIKNNPTFAVDEDEDPVDAGEEEEIRALKEDLDARGVTYRANASLDSLRSALAKAEAK